MNLDQYKNLNVLVTGGAGFIGSHLSEKLVELGAKVTILDNLSTGNIKNLETIIDKVDFIHGDITDFNTCLRATSNQNIIFHLAAFISVPDSMQNPKACLDTNINGTINLLESAKINNVLKLIFSSSSAVYGNKNQICTEDDECNPTSVYGYSKLIGETLCKQYSELFDLQTICLRYFNVYGPRQNPNGSYAAVVAKFGDAIQNNQPITIYGDGKQTRDFISVNKIVEANLKLAFLEKDYLNGQSVNIATGESINLLQLFDNLKKQFPNYKIEPIFLPERTGDIKVSQANCIKYNKLLELQ